MLEILSSYLLDRNLLSQASKLIYVCFLSIGLKACNFVKKILQQRCFPVKFVKFLKILFSTEHLRWLLTIFIRFCPHVSQFCISFFGGSLIPTTKIITKLPEFKYGYSMSRKKYQILTFSKRAILKNILLNQRRIWPSQTSIMKLLAKVKAVNPLMPGGNKKVTHT